MYRSLRSTSLCQLLMGCMIAFGLFAAPFAEAGTMTVTQAYKATTPNPDLTALVNTQTFAVASSQRSTDETTVKTLSEKTKVIGVIAMATFASASILPGAALLEKRSFSSSIFV